MRASTTSLGERRVRRLVGAAIVALVGSVLTSPAQADPIADKQAQARALSDRIDVLGAKDAALSEQYDQAALAVQSANDQLQQANAQAAQATASAHQAGSLLQADAVDAYMHGGNIADRAGRASPAAAQTTVLRSEYASSLAANQSEHLDQYRAATADAKAAGMRVESVRQEAARQAGQLDMARKATIASERQLQSTLSQVKGDLVTLVSQAEAAKQAAAVQAEQAALASQRAAEAAATQNRAVAAAQTRSAPQRAPSGKGPSPAAPVVTGPVAPTGGGGAVAVAAAMTRLGDPYVWAAAGPNTFDCSGLTMWAWAHAGVSLPHFSGSQYAATTHVSMTALQPGDLVFAANPGEHVAMYIGGGQVISAPHSGAVVRIEPLGPWFALASRP